ncbi:MAG TPA: PLP-dependent aminotransferase family protein [Magnetospirillum sp.]|nr:PLP-dependent aminotransferase family protein [Magnetospirillum sp.]
MSTWLPSLTDSTGPKYRAIVDAIAADMAAGRLSPGTRMPTHRDLAWRLKVTVGTVARAYAEAERQGLLSGEVGRGTFVRDPQCGDPAVAQYLNEASEPRNGQINMAVNRPDGDQGAWAVGPILARLARRNDLANLMAYRFEELSARHRAAGALWLTKEGAEVTPEGVAVTAGSQQAILAALAVMTVPGDAVAVEEYTYPGIKSAVSLMGRTLIPVAMDGGGLIPDEVERAFQRGAKVLYTIATVQNPMTTTLDDDRRRAIAASARRHDGFIIEDGVHRFLHPDAPPPLQVYAPERCVYLSTLSKSVSPGLRTAFATVPAALKTRFDAAIGALTLSLPTSLIEVACVMIEEGSAFEISARLRREMTARAELAVEILGEGVRPCTPAYNVWLPMVPPWRSSDFVAEAARRGVTIAPTETFAVGRPALDGVRLSISCPPDREELRRGLSVLADVLALPPTLPGITV